MTAALHVVKPGLLTTVQDLGRRGYQGLGVAVAGPMDWYSHRLANRLVGNDPAAAALEVTLIGPELRAHGDMVCAVAGAIFSVTVDGRAAPLFQPFEVREGQIVRFGERRTGTRATLAVRGGIDVPPTLGSRATNLVSRMGPFEGRALAAGDRLPLGSAFGRLRFREPKPLPVPSGPVVLRMFAGPHEDRFTDEAWRALTTHPFTVTPESNRMGYRLDGPRLEHRRGADILSEATTVGALQVPASGAPILLMADRQTTGGYTVIATVITADVPLAGQLGPGDRIVFVQCSREEATAALAEREAALA